MGNVGIGTTAPGYKLEVAGSAQISDPAGQVIRLGTRVDSVLDVDYTVNKRGLSIHANNTTYKPNLVEIYSYDGANWINRLTLKYEGNVGIGTTTPSSWLEIATVTNWWGIGLGTDGNKHFLIGRGNNLDERRLTLHIPNVAQYGGTGTIPRLEIVSSGNVILFSIKSDSGDTYIKGNVGIGTTSPTEKLEVAGNIKATGSFPLIWFGSEGRRYRIENYDNRLILADAGVRRVFEYDPSGWLNLAAGTNIYISSTGNVGIGTMAPGAKLHIRDGYLRIDSPGLGWGTNQRIISAGPLSFQPDIDDSGDPFIYFLNPAGSPTVFINTNTGNVGIGTTSPAEKLHVVGNVRIDNILEVGGAGGWTRIRFTAHPIDAMIVKLNPSGYDSWLWLENYADAGRYATIGLFRGVVSGTPRFLILGGDDFATMPFEFLPRDGKITIFGDTNLYRSAANVLKTDDDFDARSLRIGGVEVIDSARNLKNVTSIAQSLLPDVDNSRDLGSSTSRWRTVYAVTVITGDLGFEELKCLICGREFREGDDIVFRVRKVNDKQVLCIPVHFECKHLKNEPLSDS